MVAQLSTGQLCGWRSRLRLTQALLPAQSHWPASATRGGRGEGTAGGGLLPRHTWTQPCRPLPEAPAVGETGRVSVRGQPAQGPLTKAAGGAAPLRTHTEACHTEAGFRLLCCGEEATTPAS